MSFFRKAKNNGAPGAFGSGGKVYAPDLEEYNDLVCALKRIVCWPIDKSNIDSGITEFVIPEGVKSIPSYLIGPHSCLRFISVPSTVRFIDGLAFSGCRNLSEVRVHPENPCFCSTGNFVIEKNQKKLVLCVGITDGNLTVPEGTEIVGGYVANDARSVCLTLPESLRVIDSNAFCGLHIKNGLLALPGRLESLGWSAFGDCSGIKCVVLPASLREIAGNPFECCKDLTDIHVMSGNEKLSSCDGVLYTKDMETLYICPAGRKELYVPDGVRQLGYIALLGCSLDSVSLPSSMVVSSDGKLHQRYRPDIKKVVWRDKQPNEHICAEKKRIAHI